MNSSVPMKGIVAYPITPLTDSDQLDLKTYCLLLDRLIDNGSHAVAPLGSAGILPYLSDDEREHITEATTSHVAGRVPVMIGVSSLTTERAVHHARIAEKAGASAVMVIPMSYWRLTDDEIFDHYARIAESISIPIMAYNNPATAGIDMSPLFLSRLLQIDNVTMVKESSGDVNRMHQLIQCAGDDVAFFNGSNPMAYSAFAAGATGWCTAAPNLIPRLNLDLYDAFTKTKDLRQAKQVFHQQLPLLKLLVDYGLPRTVAAGLQLDGVPIGPLRSPLRPLSQTHRDELAVLLRQVRV